MLLGGSYRVSRLIGKGGMGSVYQASHTRVERQFAIKVLNVKMAGDAEVKARFEREAMLGSRLGHDHIASVMDFDYTEEGFPFLVMELLEGADLSHLIKRSGKLELLRACSIIRQTAVALTAAHAEGVVHRDLKPENIFICRRQAGGELVKVMDFGISKVLTSDSIHTSHSAILGTPWYMSPEQAEGKVTEIDHRTDLFSLGLIFYHMLAGKMPFAGDSVPSVLFNVVHGDAPSLAEACPDLPPGVVQVVERSMLKSKHERYQSANEMVDDLAAVLGDRWKDVLVFESGLGVSQEMPVIQGLESRDDIALSGTISVADAPTPSPVEQPLPKISGREPPAEDMGTAETVAGGDAVAPVVLDSLQQVRQARPTTTLSRGSGEVRADPETESVRPTRSMRPVAMAAAVVLLVGAGIGLYMLGGRGKGPAQVAPKTGQVARLQSGDTKPAPARPGAAASAAPAPVPAPSPAPKATAPGTSPGVVSPDAAGPRTRSLTVKSTPSGAKVLVDGKTAGKTPLVEQIVLQQALKVVVRKAGHRSVRRTVPQGASPVTLSVSLKSLPASINVVALYKGKPVEADIYLNGKKVDQTPAEISDLKAGKYSLRLKCKGYKSVSKSVTLTPGKRVRIAIGLVASPARR